MSIRDRVAALVQLNPPQGSAAAPGIPVRDVAVLHVHKAGRNAVSQHPFGCLRHGDTGFARAEHVNVAEARQVEAFQMTRNGLRRVGGGQGGTENRERVAAQKSGAHRRIA